MSFPGVSVVIHGHFYQPPREDPWLESVEAQPSAQPYHDWNERVAAECYRAVVAARIPGPQGRILDIRNVLARISFNFGPTLLEWLERHDRSTYEAILEADARSLRMTGGLGNAIAQAYHHSILPLATRREKETEVRWGIHDFRRRFGRDPVGMWLPETAVDGDTLDVLARAGIAFTILAPHQVKKPPPRGLPGLFKTAAGRTIALFMYDGPLSHGVAFGSLLRDADAWAQQMLASGRHASRPRDGIPRGKFSGRPWREEPPGVMEYPRLISVATDGETYGHHHQFGEMALARVLELLSRNQDTRIENFASFLDRHPPSHPVTLVEPSSWSCSHGVERWRSNCGCRMDSNEDTQQDWRGPLREALTWLASQVHELFETEAPPQLGDRWSALDRWAMEGETDASDVRTRELLEMERQTQRFFTSCGWFFDDLAGLESRQVLRYAARVLDLAGLRREDLEPGFLERLAGACSNEAPPRDGATVFLEDVKPQIPAPLRVAGGAAFWRSLETRFEGVDDGPAIRAYAVAFPDPGHVVVTHRRTRQTWECQVQLRRPFVEEGLVTVSCRDAGPESIVLYLHQLPEEFQVRIRKHLTAETPEPRLALDSSLHDLEELLADADGEEVSGNLRSMAIDQVRGWAHTLWILEEPVPFDIQTRFHRLWKSATAPVREVLQVLREPLGFTSIPPNSDE